MRQHRWMAVCSAALFVAACSLPAAAQTLIYSEDFDSLLPSLGGSVNERVGTALQTVEETTAGTNPLSGVWQSGSNGPVGWSVDNNLGTYDGAPTTGNAGVPGQGVADYGVDEWEGWNYSNLEFWVAAAGGQDREQFGVASNASGTVAVADPDEYFDLNEGPDDPVNGGYFNSALITETFEVNDSGLHFLTFDSSWRDESFDDDHPTAGTDLNNQAVEIIATFDVGGSVQVTKWNSDSNQPVGSFFKDDAADETLTIPFSAPLGATSASLSFNIANAGNDWWWAIDNVEVTGVTGAADTKLFEDFEGVALGDSINERIGPGARVTIESDGVTDILGIQYPTQSREDSFTHAGPAGWTVDNTGTPNVAGDDGVGVFEWEQWSFVTPDFWTFTDGQQRENFTKGTGVIAVADGDEWDDLGSPGDDGDLTTFMETPEISLAAFPGNVELLVEFDSSWRDEDGQTAVVEILRDGNPEEILRWESDSDSPFFHNDNPNEDVLLSVDSNGASNIALRFSYLGNNDWWWAVDNITVSTVPEPSSLLMAGLVVCCGLGLRARRRG